MESTDQKQNKAGETPKAMKSIYLEKNKSIAYFIGSFKADDTEFAEIDSTATIAKFAFAYSDVEKILFKGCSPDIGEKAFEGCESLATVIFGELGKDEAITVKKTDEKNDKKPTGDGTSASDEMDEEKDKTSILKNLTPASATDDYTIQANAFKDCAKLATLVLPKVPSGKLVIEKDAFCGCRALRTVVALCDKVDFTGNPFANSPEHLMFVCKENSEIARFARENGYRGVYVE